MKHKFGVDVDLGGNKLFSVDGLTDATGAPINASGSSSGGTPTYTAGPGMGNSPTLNMPTDNLDLSGTLTFTNGSSPTANTMLIRVTYSQTFARAPRIALFGANLTGLSAMNKLYVSASAQTTTYFEIWVYTTTNIGAGTFSINWIAR